MPTQSNMASYVDLDKAITELAKSGKPSAEWHGNILPRNVYTIAPKYLRKNTTAATAAPSSSADLPAAIQRAATAYIGLLSAVQSDYAKRFDKLAKQLDDIAQALNNN